MSPSQELIVPQHPCSNVCRTFRRFDFDINDQHGMIRFSSRRIGDWFASWHLCHNIKDSLFATGRIEKPFLFQPLGSREVESRRPLREESIEELGQKLAK